MITDIYINIPSDPSFDANKLENTNDIERIITKIKMILGTQPSSVLGDVTFGIGIDELIFQTNINSHRLENMINNQIQEYIAETSTYNIQCAVSLGTDDRGDYCIIDIIIDGVITAGVLVS